MQTIEPITHADYMAELQDENYGVFDSGDGVPVVMTEAVMDTWFVGLTGPEKAAIFLRANMAPAFATGGVVDAASSLMLRDGLNSFLTTIEEQRPMVSSANAEMLARINREVLPAVGTTFHSVAQPNDLVVQDVLSAMRAGISRSLHPGMNLSALGVGELRHTEMLPVAPVDSVEASHAA